MELGQCGGLGTEKSALSCFSQPPTLWGLPDTLSPAIPEACFLSSESLEIVHFGGIRNCPQIARHPVLSREKLRTVLPTYSPTSNAVPPCSLPVLGRLHACWGARWRGWGGKEVSRSSPRKGPPLPVLGAKATHVSSRIFLSATTSPVNLFLALYTTPYVPSPIFSTFWKFSMKR